MDCTLTVSPNKPFSLKLLLSGYFARIREKELRHSGIKLRKLNCTHVVRSHSLLPRHTTQKWPEENSIKEIIPLKTLESARFGSTYSMAPAQGWHANSWSVPYFFLWILSNVTSAKMSPLWFAWWSQPSHHSLSAGPDLTESEKNYVVRCLLNKTVAFLKSTLTDCSV